MSNSTLTSRLRLKEKEYLLQTFSLESKKLIVSARLREGKFVSQQVWEYAKGLSGEEVSRLVQTFHQSKSEETAH